MWIRDLLREWKTPKKKIEAAEIAPGRRVILRVTPWILPECAREPYYHAWLTFWYRPYQTMEKILQSRSIPVPLEFGACLGTVVVLEIARVTSLGLGLPFIMQWFVGLTLGPLLGLVSVYVVTELIGWTGLWVGGRSFRIELLAVLAWAGIPGTVGLLLYVVGLLLQEGTNIGSLALSEDVTIPTHFIGYLLLAVYLLFLLVRGLEVAQQFTWRRAAANLLLAIGLVATPLVVSFVIATGMVPRP